MNIIFMVGGSEMEGKEWEAAYYWGESIRKKTLWWRRDAWAKCQSKGDISLAGVLEVGLGLKLQLEGSLRKSIKVCDSVLCAGNSELPMQGETWVTMRTVNRQGGKMDKKPIMSVPLWHVIKFQFVLKILRGSEGFKQDGDINRFAFLECGWI